MKKILANFVPAAAVIRKGLVLFKIIGRKTYVDHYCYVKFKRLKFPSLVHFFKQIV